MRWVKVVASLRSMTPVLFSRAIPEDEIKRKDETGDKFEERVWRKRAHVTKEGQLLLPSTFFTISLQNAAKYRGDKIQGKSQATYTKHFAGGAYCVKGITLPIKGSEVDFERIYCLAQPNKGPNGARVFRNFPIVPSWKGDVEYNIIDEEINEDIFRKVLETSGLNIGIGAFRPQNRNQNGRFLVEELIWMEQK